VLVKIKCGGSVLPVTHIRAYYENAPLNIPGFWNLGRKHFRIVTSNGRFLKLNKFMGRLNVRKLKNYVSSMLRSMFTLVF
jgi:hypothetical protein